MMRVFGGLANFYQAQIEEQRQAYYDSSCLAGMGALGSLGNSAARAILTKDRTNRKTIKDELQAEVDEWLKDTV